MADETQTPVTPEAVAATPADEVTTNPEAKAEGQGAAAPAAEGTEKDTNTDQVPEEWKLSAPEGMDQYQGDLDAFAADMGTWLKANPDATPQQALAEAATRQARTVAEAQQKMIEAHETQVQKWADDARADKTIGGEKFDANLAVSIKGLDAYGDPELKQLLNETGLGNHPAMIRTFHKIGQLVADAPVATGKSGISERKPLSQSLYGGAAKP